MIKNLLATFTVDEVEGVFSVYGEYSVEYGLDFDEFHVGEKAKVIKYPSPEFMDISVTLNVNGEEKEYVPKTSSWAGRKYDVYDIAESLIAALIRGDVTYKATYLEDGLQKLVAYYTEDVIDVTVNDKKIPKKILSTDMYNLGQLLMATEQFLFYSYGDSMIMLCADTHEVITANNFAEVGYFDSVEDIKNGKEKLLWGALPKDEEE